jgi:hypothetical protein
MRISVCAAMKKLARVVEELRRPAKQKMVYVMNGLGENGEKRICPYALYSPTWWRSSSSWHLSFYASVYDVLAEEKKVL